MRFPLIATILVALMASTPVSAGTLFGVHFIDAKEGWVVGDDGVILHSLDGGKTWEQQTSGTRATLKSVYFFDESIGWAVGREQRPYGGSVGVVLFTRDGGFTWRKLLENSLPGLNAVRFTDRSTGFLLGDGVDPFSSGVFRTTDGGKSWEPVAGTRSPSWSAGDFQDGANGVFVGPFGKLASYRNHQWAFADPVLFGGRGLSDVKILNKRLVAAGDGGLVLTSASAGQAWGHADLRISPEARACLDFHAIAFFDDRVWIAGRPGSVIVRSDDGGSTWTVRKLPTTAPIHALTFVDRDRGWAVGAGGLILRTVDGGDAWETVRAPETTSTLIVGADARRLPFEVGSLGNSPAGTCVFTAIASHDAARAIPAAPRLHAAARLAGGAVGEEFRGFDVPAHLAKSPAETILAAWNIPHAGDASREFLRRLVLTLRVWRPTDVVVDRADASALSGLVHDAVLEAVKRASDPREFPEQIESLGLQPVRVRGVVAPGETGNAVDLTRRTTDEKLSPRDRAVRAHSLVVAEPIVVPPSRKFQVVFGSPPGFLAVTAEAVPQTTAERSARQLERLVEQLPRSEAVLTQLLPLLKDLSDDDATWAAYQIAWTYIRMGEWDLARETFLILVDRAPLHPLSAEACRWLARHNVSGEIRRRHELRQFAIVTPDFGATPGFGTKPEIQTVAAVEPIAELLPPLSRNDQTRTWSRGVELFAQRMPLFGSLATVDPRVQFSVQAGKRAAGDLGASREWHERFANRVTRGPWSEASAAELWASGVGPKPRRLAGCRRTEQRPTLDGKLDDACWTSQPPTPLIDAVGGSQTSHPTETWFAYDAEFLYVAVRSRHPVGRGAAAVQGRTRDADLDHHDRVSLLIDLDRDFASWYRMEIDQRGCVREDCWGDRSWNPKWYVAVEPGAEAWIAEAAIPLAELTSTPITLETRWACNLVRIIPGHGVQSVTPTADVDPRPEGLTILHFHNDARPKTPPMTPAQ